MGEEALDLSGAAELLKGLFGGEERQLTLEHLMGMLGGGQGEPSPGMATGGIDPESIAMMLRLQKAMHVMQQQKNNSRTQLLHALKPFLRPSRQSRVDQAVQMMNLSKVIAVMKEVQEE